MTPRPNPAAAPASALQLQSWPLAGRIAELFGR